VAFFRFRRSIRLLPGLRLNIGKRSASLSMGVRGAHVTLGKTGVRTTVGVFLLLGVAFAARGELGPADFMQHCRDGEQPAQENNEVFCDSDAHVNGMCTFGNAKSPVIRVPVRGTSKLIVSGRVGEFTCTSRESEDSSDWDGAASRFATGRSNTRDNDPRGKIVVMPSAEHPDARIGENPDDELERFMEELRSYKPTREDIERLRKTLPPRE